MNQNLYELLITCLRSMFDKYSFRIVNKIIDPSYIKVNIENDTTGVDVYYEYLDNIIVFTLRKLDGNERVYFKKNKMYFNCCDINLIIENSNGKSINSAYEYEELINNEHWQMDYFTMAYDKLIKYGEAILLGNFNQFLDLKNKI